MEEVQAQSINKSRLKPAQKAILKQGIFNSDLNTEYFKDDLPEYPFIGTDKNIHNGEYLSGSYDSDICLPSF